MGLSQTLTKLALDLGSGSKLLKGVDLGKRVGRGCFPSSGGDSEKRGIRSLGEVGVLPLPQDSIQYCPTWSSPTRTPQVWDDHSRPSTDLPPAFPPFHHVSGTHGLGAACQRVDTMPVLFTSPFPPAPHSVSCSTRHRTGLKPT